MTVTQTIKIINAGSDVGLEVYTSNLYELFSNSALAMFSLITDTTGIKENIMQEISVKSSNLDGLIIAYLNELIFMFDAYGFIPKRFDFIDLTENSVKVKAYGDKFDSSKSEKRLLIKAATYHDLFVKKINSNKWRLKVIFDI